MFLLWLKKAWGWLKENWKAVLLGVATLGIGLVIGRAARRKQQVINPELVGAEKTQREAQAEKERKEREAREERDRRIGEVYEEHADKVRALTEEQARRAEELRDDPDALNDYLLSVGKELRGG